MTEIYRILRGTFYVLKDPVATANPIGGGSLPNEVMVVLVEAARRRQAARMSE